MNEAYVTTPHVRLYARPIENPENPGIEILLLPAFSDKPLRLALVEYSDAERADGLGVPASRQLDSVEDDRWAARVTPGIVTKVWGDGREEDWNARTIHHRYLTEVPDGAVAVQVSKAHIYAGVPVPEEDEDIYRLTDVRVLDDPYAPADISPNGEDLRILKEYIKAIRPLVNL